jgi:hypothetical protein
MLMKTLLIVFFAAASNATASYEILWPAMGGGGGQSNGGTYALVGRFGDAPGVTATGGSYSLISSPIDAAPILPAENFAHWQSQWFTEEELADPTVSGPDQDPDGDQMGNLLDFAVDGNPMGGDAALRLSLSFVRDNRGERVRITLGRNAAARGITLLAEGSDDNASWTTLASSINGEPAAGTALVSETTGPFPLMIMEEPSFIRRRFYRARALLNSTIR